MKEVFKYLDNLNIKYEVVYHPAVLTAEEADKYVEGRDGVLTKTLFMTGKKKRRFYLFIMDEIKRLNIKKISELVQDKLHFASEEDLMNKMNLIPGSVSLFGLLNNKEHDIEVYIDKDINKEKIITFHPNDNTATIFISIKDMYKILDLLEYNYQIMEF